VLPGECEADYRRLIDSFCDATRPQNAVEFALVEQMARGRWLIQRAERHEAARVASALRAAEATAGLEHHDEVAAMGHWLTALDLLTRQEAGKALSPFLSEDRHATFARGFGEPRHIVLRLEATACGCQWLLDQWAELKVRLDRGADWRTNELIAALQLLGRRPLGQDCIEWQGWVEPIRPTGRSDAPAAVRRRMLSQFDDGLPEDPAEQRAALRRRVDEETQRLRERQAGHRRREAADRAELADRLAVDSSPEGERRRRYRADADRKLERPIQTLLKLRRAEADGLIGGPAPEEAPEPEAAGPNFRKAEGRGQKAEGGRPNDEAGSPNDEGAETDCLLSAFSLQPSAFPSPAAAEAPADPPSAGIAAPARSAAEPEVSSLIPPPSSLIPEGSSPDEPGPPAQADETARNEPDSATDGDPTARNESSPSVGGDPIAPDEPAGSRRIADWSVPALICALVLLLAAGLSAAFAGPVAGPPARDFRDILAPETLNREAEARVLLDPILPV
jgi:hypothetical protein